MAKESQCRINEKGAADRWWWFLHAVEELMPLNDMIKMVNSMLYYFCYNKT